MRIHARIPALFATLAIVFVAHVSTAKVRVIMRCADELILWIKKSPKPSEIKTRWVGVIDDFTAKHGDITDDLAEFIKKNADELTDTFMEPAVLRFVNDKPGLAKDVLRLSKECPGRELGKLLDDLDNVADTRFVAWLVRKIDGEDVVALRRALSGKNLGQKKVRLLDSLFQQANLKAEQRTAVGNLFETIVMRQAQRGRFTAKGIDIANGGKVLSGQMPNGTGIDLVCANSKGIPNIIECTTGAKDLAREPPPQMSVEWCADRWSKLIQSTDKRKELLDAGIHKKFLDPKGDAVKMAGQFNRYFVTSEKDFKRIKNRKLAYLPMDAWLTIGP